jgi:hypothetical protein
MARFSELAETKGAMPTGAATGRYAYITPHPSQQNRYVAPWHVSGFNETRVTREAPLHVAVMDGDIHRTGVLRGFHLSETEDLGMVSEEQRRRLIRGIILHYRWLASSKYRTHQRVNRT